jgi:hypothetical protein
MLINITIVILLLLILLILFYLFLANSITEGYMSIIGPMISFKEKTVSQPTNTYYKNIKITQDFDPDSVLTKFK